MKLKKFSNQIELQKYLNKIDSKQNIFYTIVKKERFFLWKKIVVLFIDREEITKELNLALKDILEIEFKINIRDVDYSFKHSNDNKKINIKLNTQNNELLIGKFGQNRKNLILFIQKMLFRIFKTFFDVDLELIRQKKQRRDYPKK